MTRELLERVGAAFLEPAGRAVDPARPQALAAGVAPSVAVLCGSAPALATGAAVALFLLRGARSGTALVLHWSGRPAGAMSPRAPAFPSARRLARSLREREHRAWASGRLAYVALPEEPCEATAAAGRAGAVAARAPCVLVAAGPRPAELEALVAMQDRVAVITGGGDPELAALALSALAERRVPACRMDLAPAGLSRLAAASGLWLGRRLRRAVGRALEEGA
jgi:hypothetical protein